MFFNQWLHLLPVESADTSSQAGNCDAFDFLIFNQLGDSLKTVIDVIDRSFSRLGPMAGGRFLGIQTPNSHPTSARPRPQFTGLRRKGLAIMPENFVHGRPLFPQGQR